jgi:hypothetical protein
MEFIWSPYEEELGSQNTQILTHFLYDHYNPPRPFHFDNKHRYSYFSDKKEIDPKRKDRVFNADSKSAELTSHILQYKKSYRKVIWQA